MTETLPATGSPIEITRGEAEAVIAPLGAGLRSYEVNGVALVETYGDSTTAPGASGILLAPWANRVRDGRWTLNGKTQQLDITEVSKNNASHGLLRNTGYTVVERTEHAVTLEAVIYPQHGFPFLMTHTAQYALSAQGDLTVEQTLTNHSPEPAPAALGAHPYLRIGEQDPAGLTLSLNAQTRLVTDDRLLPIGSESVAPEHDVRERPLAGFSIDSAFTDLEVSEDVVPGQRVVSASLRDADGQAVTLWADADSAAYLHIFVTDGLSGQDRSVAIEPMTAPADAFNSGNGLVWLGEGDSLKMRWGIISSLNATEKE
jgi:aldose 1-epimerase